MTGALRRRLLVVVPLSVAGLLATLLLADFALQTAVEPIVLDHAQFMFEAHGDHIFELDLATSDLGIIPIGTSVSNALYSEGDGVLRTLQIAFDVDYEYMRSQIVLNAEGFVIVDMLAQLSPFVDWTIFCDDTAIMLDANRADAELILRALL